MSINLYFTTDTYQYPFLFILKSNSYIHPDETQVTHGDVLIHDQCGMIHGITSAHLKPGGRLPTEHELSEQLGVSRTVVREAVKVLVATGLVYTRRGSGLYVANKASSFATTMLDSLIPADCHALIFKSL